ncbi:MAG: helix-turn-helix transcriptional regulator [Bryobacteraceae bacterium]
MDDILKQLGQRIREIRIRRGFASQEAFADYCKMHRTFIGHLETGRKDFRLTTIIRVADALGTTLAELFAGLERGQPFKSKRTHPGTPDPYRLRQELEILERTVCNLRELALPENQQKADASRSSPRPARKEAIRRS